MTETQIKSGTQRAFSFPLVIKLSHKVYTPGLHLSFVAVSSKFYWDFNFFLTITTTFGN